jgi:hypothetical protein
MEPITPDQFRRILNNFYNSKNLDSDDSRIAIDAELVNYYLTHNQETIKTKYKVAFCCICLNPFYWQYIKPLIETAKQRFLPGHQTDFFLWSDIEINNKEMLRQAEEFTIKMTLSKTLPQNHAQYTAEIKNAYKGLIDTPTNQDLEKLLNEVKSKINADKNAYADGKNDALLETQKLLEKQIIDNKKVFGATVFPTEPIEWPMPTLYRYHLMLQQEEILKDYDYIFYCDIDMLFVNIVGDEILGLGLTAVQQPMYALRNEFIPPYEPNPQSASHIKRPGKIIEANGKKKFLPLYFAGGFQGGKSDKWLEAMKAMKELVDKDMKQGYIPIWNDESVWNKYLAENLTDTDVVLNPSYTYPDSLQKEYFVPMWGRDYQPKLVTLTKKFTLSAEGGTHVVKTTQELQTLK